MCYLDYGPAFNGGGKSDLAAFQEPFNGYQNCMSAAEQHGFFIGLDQGKNMLTD